jgi:hypothetical protein
MLEQHAREPLAIIITAPHCVRPYGDDLRTSETRAHDRLAQAAARAIQSEVEKREALPPPPPPGVPLRFVGAVFADVSRDIIDLNRATSDANALAHGSDFHSSLTRLFHAHPPAPHRAHLLLDVHSYPPDHPRARVWSGAASDETDLVLMPAPEERSIQLASILRDRLRPGLGTRVAIVPGSAENYIMQRALAEWQADVMLVEFNEALGAADVSRIAHLLVGALASIPGVGWQIRRPGLVSE